MAFQFLPFSRGAWLLHRPSFVSLGVLLVLGLPVGRALLTAICDVRRIGHAGCSVTVSYDLDLLFFLAALHGLVSGDPLATQGGGSSSLFLLSSPCQPFEDGP